MQKIIPSKRPVFICFLYECCTAFKKKERPLQSFFVIFFGAPPEGFEPATYGLEDRCSIQLSYRGNLFSLDKGAIRDKPACPPMS